MFVKKRYCTIFIEYFTPLAGGQCDGKVKMLNDPTTSWCFGCHCKRYLTHNKMTYSNRISACNHLCCTYIKQINVKNRLKNRKTEIQLRLVVIHIPYFSYKKNIKHNFHIPMNNIANPVYYLHILKNTLIRFLIE